jgi:hypothetical protein
MSKPATWEEAMDELMDDFHEVRAALILLTRAVESKGETGIVLQLANRIIARTEGRK